LTIQRGHVDSIQNMITTGSNTSSVQRWPAREFMYV